MYLLPLIFGGEILLIGLVFYLLVILIEIRKRLGKTNRILIWIGRLLKKIVVSVTVVSVKTDAASYEHANPVNITGDVTLDGTPQANVPVNLKVVDIAGTEFALPDATTGADGKFTAAWTIPTELAPGVCTLTATALGMTVTTTFTFKQPKNLSE